MKNIFLQNDKPGEFPPIGRKQKWGQEKYEFSEICPEKLEEQVSTFVSQILSEKLHQTNIINEEIFLQFHLHKDIIYKLLAQDQSCCGIKISLAAKEYIFKGSDGTETPKTGTSLIIVPIDEKMDIIKESDEILICANLSPCPPKDPCPKPSQLTLQNDSESFSQS